MESGRGDYDFERDVFPAELARIAERQRRVFPRVHTEIEAAIDRAAAAAPVLAPAPSPETGNGLGGRESSRAVVRWLTALAAAVRSRLRPAGRAAGGGESAPGVNPSTDFDLVGLALSGGGIRSATFNLGVLQALNERRVLRHVDYLSTVSGGGYLGACLSSILNRLPPDAEPFATDDRGHEAAAIRHLRENSNYLAPGGLLDMARIPALLLRGILLHFLVIFPYLVLAVWLTDRLYGDALRGLSDLYQAGYAADHRPDAFDLDRFYRFTPWALVAYLVYVVVTPVLQRLGRRLPAGGRALRDLYEKSFGALLLAALGVALVETLPTLLSLYDAMVRIRAHDASGLVVGLQQGTWWIVLAALFAFPLAGRFAKARSRLVLVALGLLGPLLFLIVYLYLGEWGIFGASGHLQLEGFPGAWASGLPYHSWVDTHGAGDGWLNLTVLAVLLWLWTLRYVDVNKTSLHGFYRDRLSGAYLFHLLAGARIEENDALKLSELCGPASVAPYHLINAAVNLQASRDPGLRGRRADFFYFSRDFCGSRATGYCPTRDLETRDGGLDLGTAMAISGAAAAPNMGSATVGPLVFVMTLLNVRLGYWLPNPLHARRPGLRTGVGPFYLLAELFSLLDARSRYVNVSDGGHLENLGIYQLLRRRCRFIIACDAEADPQLNFGGLATVIRFARIDLGVEIELELEDVRRGPDGLSRRQYALGKIRYPDDTTGHILYVKASLAGVEDESIREYRARNRDFPHQTTADQFFDEAQFEAYRALGQLTGRSLFPAAAAGASRASHAVVEEWFQALSQSLRPRHLEGDRLGGLQRRLTEIEGAFADPALAAYSFEIYPELAPAGGRAGAAPAVEAEAGERARRVFHLCKLQMQLIESAVLELDLDRPGRRDHPVNRGWMNLFRRWAQAPSFRRAWAVGAGGHGVAFQRFCEDALGLSAELRWRPGANWAKLSERERTGLARRGLDRHFRQVAAAGGEGWGRHELWMAEIGLGGEREAGGESATGDAAAGSDAFPVGLAVLRFAAGEGAKGVAELRFYRIRRMYRQMNLLERMLRALAGRLEEDYLLRVVFPANEAALAKRNAYLFERCGFEIGFEEAAPPAEVRAA